MAEFIKGMDISTLKELEELGAKYYNKNTEMDLLTILGEYGVNAVRLRLWHNPYSEDGDAYGAGTNDLDTTLELAKRSVEKGFQLLLNFHYSDFWTDPGKQFIPKAWRGFNDEQLEAAVFSYTKETMERLKKENIVPNMVQVGNELTNGLLWPNGKKPNYDNIAKFINAGIRGVRSVCDEIPIMIHLDNGGNNELYRDWFDHFIPRAEAFEVIGLSYYPFWHGTLDDLEYNMNDIAKRYEKDLIVTEVSMGYTMEDYKEYEDLDGKHRKGMATKPELVEKIEYPMTPEGQADFMNDILKRIVDVPNGRGKGFYYWEPAWIPVKGSGWANDASLKYIEDKDPGGNEWANQALFDYEGNVLPALSVIRDFNIS